MEAEAEAVEAVIKSTASTSLDSTQTASVFLSAFKSDSINSKMISFEDCVEMIKAKLNIFI